jgi:hypothetical protein
MAYASVLTRPYTFYILWVAVYFFSPTGFCIEQNALRIHAMHGLFLTGIVSQDLRNWNFVNAACVNFAEDI